MSPNIFEPFKELRKLLLKSTDLPIATLLPDYGLFLFFSTFPTTPEPLIGRDSWKLSLFFDKTDAAPEITTSSLNL
jgi:hypothetical protein